MTPGDSICEVLVERTIRGLNYLSLVCDVMDARTASSNESPSGEGHTRHAHYSVVGCAKPNDASVHPDAVVSEDGEMGRNAQIGLCQELLCNRYNQRGV
jgi:hypothetical protein